MLYFATSLYLRFTTQQASCKHQKKCLRGSYLFIYVLPHSCHIRKRYANYAHVNANMSTSTVYFSFAALSLDKRETERERGLIWQGYVNNMLARFSIRCDNWRVCECLACLCSSFFYPPLHEYVACIPFFFACLTIFVAHTHTYKKGCAHRETENTFQPDLIVVLGVEFSRRFIVDCGFFTFHNYAKRRGGEHRRTQIWWCGRMLSHRVYHLLHVRC